MGTDEIVDLTDVDWPLCLLQFNEVLRCRPPGTALEVWIRDPLVVESVNMIVRNSGYRVIRMDRADDCFHICIRNTGYPHPEERG
jgi:TusA-related sulfurtransferase